MWLGLNAFYLTLLRHLSLTWSCAARFGVSCWIWWLFHFSFCSPTVSEWWSLEFYTFQDLQRWFAGTSPTLRSMCFPTTKLHWNCLLISQPVMFHDWSVYLEEVQEFHRLCPSCRELWSWIVDIIGVNSQKCQIIVDKDWDLMIRTIAIVGH